MESWQRPLRPMNLGELLDTSFALYRQNFALFAGIVAVLTIPETIVNLVIAASTPNPSTAITTSETGVATVDYGAVIIANLATGVVTLVFSILITGALSQAVAARYLGRPMTVGQAYSTLGVGVFVALFLASILNVVLVGLGFVLLIIPGVYLLVRFVFVSPLIVLERTGVFSAFSRSGQLVRGSWWRIFGIGIVIVVLVGILQGVILAVVGALVALGNGTGARLATTALTGLASIIVQPFQAGALVLLYYDMRIRKEGFDLEEMARRLEAPARL